jgi:hypothetical protein
MSKTKIQLEAEVFALRELLAAAQQAASVRVSPLAVMGMRETIAAYLDLSEYCTGPDAAVHLHERAVTLNRIAEKAAVQPSGACDTPADPANTVPRVSDVLRDVLGDADAPEARCAAPGHIVGSWCKLPFDPPHTMHEDEQGRKWGVAAPEASRM